MEILKFVRPYIQAKSKLFAFFIVLSSLSSVLALCMPFIMGEFIDSMVTSKEMKLVFSFAAILLVIYISEMLLNYFSDLSMMKLQSKVSFNLNIDVIQHAQRISMMYFYDKDAAYLTQRINGDSSHVASFVLSNAVRVFIRFFVMLSVIVFLFWTHFQLAVIIMFIIPVYIAIYYLFRKKIFAWNYLLSEKQNRFYSRLNEQLSLIRHIKLNVLFEPLSVSVMRRFGELFNLQVDSFNVFFMFSGSAGVAKLLMLVALFVIGGSSVVEGSISIGEFIAINSYFSMLLNDTGYFLGLGQNYQTARVSFERIKDILAQPIDSKGGGRVCSIEKIELSNLNFGYVEKEIIIENFSYCFEKGKIYCISGENGAGKTTLLMILVGMLVGKTDGVVSYNAVNIEELDVYETRKRFIGFLNQEQQFLQDTVGNNLRIGLSAEEQNGLEYWIEKLGLSNLVKHHKDFMNCQIADIANNISGGEKQKLALARILAKKPQVLVLDEPTSALDHGSVIMLAQILQKDKLDRITVIVTHNEHFKEIADQIIEL